MALVYTHYFSAMLLFTAFPHTKRKITCFTFAENSHSSQLVFGAAAASSHELPTCGGGAVLPCSSCVKCENLDQKTFLDNHNKVTEPTSILHQ